MLGHLQQVRRIKSARQYLVRILLCKKICSNRCRFFRADFILQTCCEKSTEDPQGVNIALWRHMLCCEGPVGLIDSLLPPIALADQHISTLYKHYRFICLFGLFKCSASLGILMNNNKIYQQQVACILMVAR